MCFSVKKILEMELHFIKGKERKLILELVISGWKKIRDKLIWIQKVMEGLWMVRIG